MLSEKYDPILADLAESAARLGYEQERRLGHLSELAEGLLAAAVTAGGNTPSSLTAALAGLVSLPQPMAGDDTPEFHRAAVVGALSLTALLDRVMLTRLLAKGISEQIGTPLALWDMDGGVQPLPERRRVVSVRSQLSDAALARFGEVLDFTAIGDRRSLREVMDDVDSGYADYGILPLYSDGLPIQSVCADLDTYGLKLSLITYLPNGEGNVCYGLFSRTCVTPCPPRGMLLLHVPAEDGAQDLLPLALTLLGARVSRADAVPLSRDRRRCGYRISAIADSATLPLLLLYQTIFSPGDTVCGFFAEV